MSHKIVISCMLAVSVFIPFQSVTAITQSQIAAEVQVVCPDNYGNKSSGSGTVIDPRGIILTNRHVVSDQYGEIIKTCFVGFTEIHKSKTQFWHTN